MAPDSSSLHTPPHSNSRTFTLLVTLSFFLITGFVTAHHEMWRDEVQAWLTGRDCRSIPLLLHVMSYAGSPPLWPLSLWFLSHLGQSPQIMQLWHVGLATAFVFVLCDKAPFTRLQKVLLSVLNFYVFYQYGVIARNYLPGLLCLALACASYDPENQHPVRLGVMLSLACLTSVHAMIVAVGIACGLAVDGFGHRLNAADTSGARRHRYGVTLTLFAIGVSVAAWLTKPTPDRAEVLGEFFALQWSRVAALLCTYAKAFFAVPLPTRHFWETSCLGKLPPNVLAFAGLMLLIGCLVALSSEAVAWVSFAVGTFGLGLLFYARYWGFDRHHGFFFFCFLFSLWLLRAREAAETSSVLRTHRDRWTDIVLGCILLSQTAGGVIAGVADIRYPFSCGPEAGRYIASLALPNTFVSACPIYLGSSIAGELRQPLFYAQGKRWGTLTLYDRRSDETLDEAELISRVVLESQHIGQNVLLVVDRPLYRDIAGKANFQFLKAFTGSIVGDEDCYLYYRPLQHPAPEKP